MMTIREVSRLTGLSVRTLQYYDEIGLMHPAERTAAGYRLYDETSMARLQQIMLFRALAFPLEDIGRIIDHPDFDRRQALEDQIALLTMKRDHLNGLIAFARGLMTKGGNTMDFTPFSTADQEAYAKEAKTRWGQTAAWQEHEAKSARRTQAEEDMLSAGLMEIFVAFGAARAQGRTPGESGDLVQRLQAYITANYYTCTDVILRSLGEMYRTEAFAGNIDKAAGEGAAAFAADAIAAWNKEKGRPDGKLP